MTLTTIFIILILIVLFIYLGYPFLIIFLSIFKKNKEFNSDYLLTVSLIIACHNEEKIISDKIINTLKLNYPKDKLEIIIFSDGSTDNTNSIINSFKNKGIKLVDFPNHPGKTICQNECVKKANGEIIVFSDANSMYKENAIKELVKPFQNKNIGTVVGALNYTKDLNNFNNEGLYWKYENTLKTAESKIGMILGANGAIYAIKKEDYVPLKEWVISDFIEPLKINQKKLKTIYQAKAIAYEEPPLNHFKRKVRIILRSMSSLSQVKSLFNPFKYPSLSFSLFWHKLMRWLTPVWLILILLINIILLINNPEIFLFKLILIFQALFYLFSILGKRIKIFKVFHYFVLINIASFIALILTLKGKKQSVWNIRK